MKKILLVAGLVMLFAGISSMVSELQKVFADWVVAGMLAVPAIAIGILILKAIIKAAFPSVKPMSLKEREKHYRDQKWMLDSF